MNTKRTTSGFVVLALAFAGLGFLDSPSAWAHCDTLSGPVVTDAKKAIETKDVDLVLKWIGPRDEEEIRSLFDKTLEAREKGEDVRELADMHFLETLVRVHRAGEGVPYTGLKPADTPLEPGIEAAEEALESESDSAIASALQGKLESSVSKRFQRTVEAKKHKDENVAAGREYVEAYVDFIHYVEHLHSVLTVTSQHGHEAGAKDQQETPVSETAEDHH